MDQQILKIAREMSLKCKELLLSKKDLIEKLAKKLMEKETLDLSDIKEILGDRPFPLKSNFKAYMETHESFN